SVLAVPLTSDQQLKAIKAYGGLDKWGGPRPRRCVMRSHARATPLVQATVRFDCLQLLIARKRDAVKGSHFIERPVLRSFHARAVVTEDVNNEGVVGEAHVLDRLHDASNAVV